MTTSLLDLSGKIDPFSLGLYEVIAEVAAAHHVRFFVVGATARDTILTWGYGLPVRRETKDVDIGLLVSAWEEFARLKRSLVESKEFKDTNDVKRVRYKDKIPVDIVPFGPIEQPKREITWPPDHTGVMSVLGFDVACKAAQLVRLRPDPPLDVLFASPAGLALMKIAAWADRHDENKKDALDLAYIMKNYLDAGNEDRLFEDHPDLLDGENFDYARTGTRLLGRDISMIVDEETKARILEILQAETSDQSQYQLVQDMMTSPFLAEEERERSFEEHLLLLNELRNGIGESRKATGPV